MGSVVEYNQHAVVGGMITCISRGRCLETYVDSGVRYPFEPSTKKNTYSKHAAIYSNNIIGKLFWLFFLFNENADKLYLSRDSNEFVLLAAWPPAIPWLNVQTLIHGSQRIFKTVQYVHCNEENYLDFNDSTRVRRRWGKWNILNIAK